MLKFTLRATPAALLVAAVAFPISAQPPARVAQPATVAGQPVASPANAIRAKQVLGTKIMIQNNTDIGTVDDIVFDEAGNLEYLVVATGENKYVTVPWEAAKWDLQKKVGVVNITPEVYKTIPTYTTTTYPSFYTPAYRTTIYKTYGLTPRELRRLERRIP